MLVLSVSEADRLRLRDQVGAPGWVMPGASLDFDFQNGRYWQSRFGCRSPRACLTVTRSTPETSLLPTSAAGATYLTFAGNTAAIVPGVGIQLYEQGHSNFLLNSTAPATQTTASLPAGSYTLWVNGTGSATSAPGSATGSGFGTATNGSPNSFTLTGAGTVVVTVSGPLNAFQLENGTFGTPLIVTGGAIAARDGDKVFVNGFSSASPSFTAFVSGTPYAPAAYATVQTPLQIDPGNNGPPRYDFDRQAGTGVDPSQVTVWDTGQFGKTLLSVTYPAKAAFVFNGGAVNPSFGVSSAFNPARLVIGANGNFVHQWNGIVARVAFFPQPLPAAEMQALSR
ncbi:MAG TPA: hypothetical protein VG651_13785 [Stellaceae bacterium]|nr:hypothetical protein [Stellaceae bacterium]